MNKTITITALVKEAVAELSLQPKLSRLDLLKRYIREHILGQLVAPNDTINWPKGCLAGGLAAVVHTYANAVPGSQEAAARTMALAALHDFFDGWIEKGSPVYTVDDLLAADALLSLYEETGQEKYRKAADKMAEFLYRHDTDEVGSLPYRPLHKTGHIFADGIGMICPFASHYSFLTGDQRAVEIAITQFTNFMAFGMDTTTGLPFHGYKYGEISIDHDGDSKKVISCDRFGMVGWGRAVGWVYYGLGESIPYIRQNKQISPEKKELLEEAYAKMTNTMLGNVNEEGLFRAAFSNGFSPVDTSASGMILCGMLAHNRKESDILRGMHSLHNYIADGKVEGAQGECGGFDVYSTQYGSYPWSVGMTLKLLAQIETEQNDPAEEAE